ncbi:hypothetical protein Salat_1674500 [Sesamum alatum]|uniref:Uncharacterized protein n=1 Tax=Sesamum alatum TaxID=300844 RepID=A0AAE1Y6W2_9LAMI|nr:hypothetical protein Salat_1674500 [Sesamum alatum]
MGREGNELLRKGWRERNEFEAGGDESEKGDRFSLVEAKVAEETRVPLNHLTPNSICLLANYDVVDVLRFFLRVEVGAVPSSEVLHAIATCRLLGAPREVELDDLTFKNILWDQCKVREVPLAVALPPKALLPRHQKVLQPLEIPMESTL